MKCHCGFIVRRSSRSKPDAQFCKQSMVHGYRHCVIVKFKLESGAEANILPWAIYKTLQGPVQLQPTSTILVTCRGTKLKPQGVAKLQCATPKMQLRLPYITSHSSTPTLDKEAYEQMQLLKRIETVVTKHPVSKEKLIAQYPTVFEGLDQFPGEQHIHIDPKVPPMHIQPSMG